MTEIERVQAYVVDVDTVLRIRDDYYRQVRGLQLEAEVIGRAALDGFEKQQQQALEETQMALNQADECFRVSQRMLFTLTGRETIDEARVHLTLVKTSLNKIAEARARQASATADKDAYTALKQEALEAVASRELEMADEEVAMFEKNAVALVPVSYTP